MSELERLSLPDLLDRMAGLEVPPPVPYWPQTIGWAVLTALVAVAVAVSAWWQWRRWRSNAYRRAALRALRTIELREDGEAAAELALLLRRTALAAYPRRQVAGLYGREWLAFLDRTGGTTAFSDGDGQALLAMPYRRCDGKAPTRLGALPAVVGAWIRDHRVEHERVKTGHG